MESGDQIEAVEQRRCQNARGLLVT